MRMHHLAEEVHLSQSALSRLVSRLERDGLLSRSMCEDDRRGIFVTLTDLGRQRHTAALPAQREVLTTHIGVASPAQIGAASPAHLGAASPAAGAASPALGATSPASTWETTDGQLALAEGTR
jgi:DNA-binding transcriptional LysR family regulator